MAKAGNDSLVKRLRDLRAQSLGNVVQARGARGETSQEPRESDQSELVGDAAGVSDLVRRMATLGLERTRQDRVKPSRDLSLADEIDSQARLIRSVQKGIAKVVIAWDQILAESGLPDELLARVAVKSYRRGILTIRVRDSGTQYLLARFLRAGGEAKLARLAPVVVSKVKLVM